MPSEESIATTISETPNSQPVSEIYHYPAYETLNRTTTEFLFPHVSALLKKHLGGAAGKSVLDSGCGNGVLCRYLAEQDYDVSGFDLSPSGIDLAKKLLPKHDFRQASVYDNPHELFGRQFDAIVSMEVVEHLYDPREFIRQTIRGIKPGGFLVITTPYYGYLKNLAIAATGRFDRHFTPLWDGGHIKFWSPTTLRSLLTEFGLQPIDFKGVGRLPWLWRNQIHVAKKT